MDRRFLTVLGVSLVFALVVSSIFYQMTARTTAPAKKAERTDVRDLVVAARPLPIGINVKAADVKTIKVAPEAFPKGAFSKVEEVIDRPVVSNVLLDEPVLEGRLAARGSGIGLAPIIPVGYRAVTLAVNDVAGVAGFVLPGMRVDVLVTGTAADARGRMTYTVLQNILVLSAGQAMQPDAKGGATINAPNVTLLVTPEQAETLTLAGNEGRIQLSLRNGSDQTIEKTGGRLAAELYGARRSPAPNPDARPARPRPAAELRPVMPVTLTPPAPPPPPPPSEVVVIRGTDKKVEVVGLTRKEQ